MSNRTPSQYAADRRRSHKARARKEQAFAAQMFRTRQAFIRNGYAASTINDYASAMATTAKMARSHLNFVLTGVYSDFTGA